MKLGARQGLGRRIVQLCGVVLGSTLLSALARAGDWTVQLSPLSPAPVIGGSSHPVAGGQIVGVLNQHAVVWNAGQAVDLNPANLSGILSSNALGTDGAQQVGYGYGSSPSVTQALLWQSSPTAINLNPSQLGISTSEALGVGGHAQVGDGSGSNTGGSSHALLWSGSASSAVDLNPTNLSNVSGSSALATNGTDQVGMALRGSAAHAVLWRGGQAGSAVDLNPAGLSMDSSYAYGISPDGAQQVGVGNSNSGPLHAVVWNGNATNAVDLNPVAGYVSSEALDTNGQEQVGEALYKLSDECNCTRHHAMIWDGTAQSAVDLHLQLPSTFSNSEAYSIDPAGDVFGVAYDATGGAYAVEWSPAPEPGAAGLLLMGLCIVGMLCRPRCQPVAPAR